ncbi:MAG: 4Fe-4S binding protein [Holosporales bacterium]|jgi:formate hydrogenlyase subunit 6/NADH:ubiquinone oxidoreductase subunit I|nr:4Fe-4S binding protein [Holosporales bacterium]
MLSLQIITKILRTLLLIDILKALVVGFVYCFRKPVTKNLENIRRPDKFRKYVIIDRQKCVACRACERICPCKAIKIDKYEFNKNKCAYCGLCEKACIRGAIKIRGNIE